MAHLRFFLSQHADCRWKFSSAGNMLITMLSIDDYSTAKEMAEQWGITTRMVINYCDRNLIQGAVKKGTLWLIPTMAEKPEDRRLKSYRNKQRIEG